MARNSEKAQSMLYRFRESQAIEMGLGNRQKGDRRPRMASSVTSLRECERWRGDILRDINRKVSKIQDASLTDYQIRDLNDEINQLMRDKRHYETQIVNLGGANYKRGNQSMLDDEGKEVPGTRGYKYFGRAKELPGVKEMFTKGAAQASEESARNASFQMFRNQGTEYYGDNDELDGKLLEEEEAEARREWDEAVAETSSKLSIAETPSIPYPGASSAQATQSTESTQAVEEAPAAPAAAAAPKKGKGKGKAKRKAEAEPGPNDVETEEPAANDDPEAKKAKTTEDTEADAPNTANASDEYARQAAAIAASFLGVLDAGSLRMPELPNREQMSEILLDVRKKALREEYGV